MSKILIFVLWFLFHPVHVTLTSVDYDKDSNSLKVFVKMYFDDFLLDLKLTGLNPQEDGFSGDDTKSRSIMENYLNNRLIINVNKKLYKGKLNDLEIADNEVKMNFEYRSVKDPDVISVRNLILTELYKDQTNLIIIKVKDFEEGIKLTADNTEQTFEIK